MLGILLLGFARINILDITNDEAYSFKLIHQLSHDFTIARNQMIGTANTHWLNSFFLWIEQAMIGTEVWMLRLHSFFALGLFLYGLYRIFHEEKKMLILIPLLLLVGNHYLFDFFSLARGYALAFAFEMMALHAIIRRKKTSLIYLWLVLSCLSNYTNLYLLAAFLLLDIVQQVRDSGKRSLFTLSFIKPRWSLIPFFLWALPNLYFIKYVTKDLEEGQRNNFITDTLGVFLERSFSGMNATLYFSLASLLLFTTLYWFYVHRQKIPTGWRTIFLLFFSIITFIHLFYFFLNTPYPYGRTSFSLWLIFLLLLSYIMIDLLKKLKPAVQHLAVVLLISLNLIYLLTQVPMNTTVEWPKQQGMKAWVQALKKKYPGNNESLKVVMSIDHYGVYDNYYRYLDPIHLPSHILVYDRKGYDQIPDTLRTLFQEQDEFLMYGSYKSFLDSIVPRSKRLFNKRYPDMETDWWSRR